MIEQANAIINDHNKFIQTGPQIYDELDFQYNLSLIDNQAYKTFNLISFHHNYFICKHVAALTIQSNCRLIEFIPINNENFFNKKRIQASKALVKRKEDEHNDENQRTVGKYNFLQINSCTIFRLK